MEEEICSRTKKKRDLQLASVIIAGKEAVRDVIVLTPSDIAKKSMGRNYFHISYCLINDGFMPVKDFENIIYFNDKVAGQHKSLSVGPNERKTLEEHAALDIQDGTLVIRADAFSRVQEDDESNNDLAVTLLFKGFRKGVSLEPVLHIEALRIANRTPIAGMLKLQKRDSIGEKKGRYGFIVEYVIRNYGSREAIGVDNLFLLNGKRFFRHPNISLKAGESKLVRIPVYFPIKSGKITLRADANNKYLVADEATKELHTKVFFMGF